MRSTAVAVAALLLLSGCGDGPEKPDGPEPGPLRLADGAHACDRGAGSMTAVYTLDNTADIPLTIDEVAVDGAENAVLTKATVGTAPAVDSTIVEQGLPGARTHLRLHFQVEDMKSRVSFSKVTVDYHNVEGRFRASSATPFEVTRACP